MRSQRFGIEIVMIGITMAVAVVEINPNRDCGHELFNNNFSGKEME